MKGNLKLIGGRKIESPKTLETRPTTLMVREAVFNILNEGLENSYWLDLFSGSGSVACEALNHGARKVVAIEKNRTNADICLRNLKTLKQSPGINGDFEVICKDALIWLKKRKNDPTKSNILDQTKFNFIYLDPPYALKNYDHILEKIFTSNAINLNTIVICEHSSFKEIKGNNLWLIKDQRSYGKTQLSFLIKI